MKRVSSYPDLESAICDLENMAHVAAQYLEGHMRREGDRFTISLPSGDAIAFCAYRLEAMAQELKAAFYGAQVAEKRTAGAHP